MESELRDLIGTIEKTKRNARRTLTVIGKCHRAGKISDEEFEHKRAFYGDLFRRLDGMKEIALKTKPGNLRLRRLREEQDLSQAAMARKLGISRFWYLQLEAGAPEISTEIKKRVCKVLDLPFRDVFPVDN